MHILQADNLVQCFELHVVRERRRETVQIVLVRALALGFEEELVLLLVGKGAQFVLDARAVAWADAANRTVEQRRIVESLAQCVVHLLRGIDQEARHLILNGLRFVREREFRRTLVAPLWFECLEIDSSRIESRRSAGLHSTHLDTHLSQRLGDADGRRVARSASRCRLPSAVHQSREECAGGEDDGLRLKFDAHLRL